MTISVKDASGVPTSINTINDLMDLVGEVQASPTANTVLDRLKTLATALTTLQGYVDGLEGYTDGIETLITATNSALTTLAGYTDGVETALALLHTDLVAGQVAQLGARTVAQSPAINIATDDPIAKKIGTRAYTWASAIARTVTSASAQTAAVGTAGEYEISTDTDCYVLIGSNPTAAATTSRFMAAGSAWTLQLGSADKVAVIRKSADGNLLVLPVA